MIGSAKLNCFDFTIIFFLKKSKATAPKNLTEVCLLLHTGLHKPIIQRIWIPKSTFHLRMRLRPNKEWMALELNIFH